MTLIDYTHHAEHNRIMTLQKHVELVQKDNQQLKENLSAQEERYRVDQDYWELKAIQYSKVINELHNTQQQLESELCIKTQDLHASQKETQYWKRLYESVDIERQEFVRQKDSWNHLEARQMDRLHHQEKQQQQQQKNNAYQQRSSFMETSSGSPRSSYRDDHSIMTYTTSLPAGRSTPLNHCHDRPKLLRSSSKDKLQLSNQPAFPSLRKRSTQWELESAQQTNSFRQQHILTNHHNGIKVPHPMDQVDSTTTLSQSLMKVNEADRLRLYEKTPDDHVVSDHYVQVSQSDDVCPNPFELNGNVYHLYQKETTDGNAPRLLQSTKTRKLSLANRSPISMPAYHSFTPKLTLSYEEMVEEIRTLEDTNQALQLYINRILTRIMNNKHMETILSIDPPRNHAATTLKITPAALLLGNSLSNNKPQATANNIHQHRHDSRTANSWQSVEGAAYNDTTPSNTVTACPSGDDDDSWTHIGKWIEVTQ